MPSSDVTVAIGGLIERGQVGGGTAPGLRDEVNVGGVELFHEREVGGNGDVVDGEMVWVDLVVLHRGAACVEPSAEMLELAELVLWWEVADLGESVAE